MSFDIDKDLKYLEEIRRDVPLMVVSQIDLCWLVSSLFFYIRKYKDIKQELENEQNRNKNL